MTDPNPNPNLTLHIHTRRYYDYSAVLYLNTQGEHFEGGLFKFIDANGFHVVAPRAGRCVVFSSGAEHLHQGEKGGIKEV